MKLNTTTIAAMVGTIIMVLTTAVHTFGAFLPGQDVTVVNMVIAVLTWVSVHVLHTKAAAAAHLAGKLEAEKS